ncbi:GNAT family N-acetyltransferase [Streptococcaceae bacterium ESL0687]|nr:GNAT family N-acetyltransferase [Streptococcaceae bacterium ESL0687]
MIEFRYAKKEDLGRIVEIYNQAVPTRLSTADLEPIEVESRIGWFEAHNPDKRPLWLIIYQGQIAGWMSFSDFYGRPAYSKTAEISIYLDTSFRRLGLGQKALTYAESQVSRLGIDTLLAFIFGHNQASQKLFLKNCFTPWGHLPQVALMDEKLYDLDILGKSYIKKHS